MKTLQATLEHILATASPITQTETVPLTQALGRYLAADIIAPLSVPPADNSAMDGYAVHSQDIKDLDAWLTISQTINAGATSTPLSHGTAARIFTGAEIPEGADSVVIQENCQQSDDGTRVKILKFSPNDNIRHRGQDISEGQEIFRRGHRLSPVDVGVLASLGYAQITVVRKLRVAIVSTGDELAEPGTTLRKGQIYNSNRYTLHAALIALGCEILDLGCAADNLQATQEALLQGVEADFIISTGGVSVGDADFIKPAVASLGELTTWKLAIKPGKPLAFGHVKNTPFFGLPGNPVAVFVTFVLVIKAYIKVLNNNNTPLATRLMPADFEVSKPSDRTHYLRVKISPEGKIEKFNNQSSGVLSSVAWADGLAIIPADSTVKRGQFVDVILLNDQVFN